MTEQELVCRVDEQIPNTIPCQEKIRWVSQMEQMLRTLFPSREEDTLTADHPWEDVYLHFLEMKIYYAQGETARYNQANALFQAAYDNYRNHRNRTAPPPQNNIRYF